MKRVLYKYLREDGSPYYIGIGLPDRPFAPHKHGGANLLPANPLNIVIMETGLSFNEAKELEKYWIAFYGRKDLGTGILRNRTNGGEGTSGLKRTEESKAKGTATKIANGTNMPSIETIAKRVATRKANGGYGLSPESSAKRIATIKERGKNKQSKETIAKRVKSIRDTGGYDRAPEVYAKVVESRKNNGKSWNPAPSYARGWETRRIKLLER